MALSDAEIKVLYADETGFILDESPAALLDFARAIEAEVRKQDTALIRQMDAALDASEAFLLSAGFESSDAFQEVSAALTAARAWLEGKPCA